MACKATVNLNEEYCDSTCFLSNSAGNSVELVSPSDLNLNFSAEAPQVSNKVNDLSENAQNSDEWSKSRFIHTNSVVETQSIVSEDSDNLTSTDDESIVFDLHKETFQLLNPTPSTATMEAKDLIGGYTLGIHQRTKPTMANTNSSLIKTLREKTFDSHVFSSKFNFTKVFRLLVRRRHQVFTKF